MIFIINAQGTITAVSPSPVHQGSIGVNDIIIVSPALADRVTLNATLPNGIKINPIDMAIVYPSVIEGYTEGYYIYRTTLNESVTQYPGLLTLRFSIKLNEGGTLTTSTAVIHIVDDMGIIEPTNISLLDNNADTGNIIGTINEIITKLNSTYSNASSALNAANTALNAANTASNAADTASNAADEAGGYREQAQAWATGEIGDNNTPVLERTPQYNNNAKYYAAKASGSVTSILKYVTETRDAVTTTSKNAENASKSAGDAKTVADEAKTAAGEASKSAYAASGAVKIVESIAKSIQVSYDPSKQNLNITYMNSDGNYRTSSYNFVLSSFIDNIEEIEEYGNYYLVFTLVNGIKTRIPLDDITRGFVKSQAGIVNASKIYGINNNGKDALYTTDKHFYPSSYFKDSIVLRRADGDIYLPKDSNIETSAARVGQVNAALNQAKAFTSSELEEFMDIFGNGINDVQYRLDQLESASLKYTEFSGVTDAVPVPINAAKHVPVYKVGGMTYKCNNKLPFPYSFESGYKHGGITATINADQSITFNGTAEFFVHIPLVPVALSGSGTLSFGTNIPEGMYLTENYWDMDSDMPVLNYYDLSGKTSIQLPSFGGEYLDFSISEGRTFDNFTIYPMLADKEMPYEPYFEGLRDTKVTELVSEGANLIPTAQQTVSNKGITSTINPDGSVTFAGVATETGNVVNYIYSGKLEVNIPAGTYSISVAEGEANSTYRMEYYLYHPDGTETTLNRYYPTRKVTQPVTHLNAALVYTISQIGEVVNKTFYPMLNRGETAVPYKPYRGTIDTFPISAELRAFLEDKGYGRGVEGYYGYIDFENKLFYPPQTYRKVFDGTERVFASTVDDGTYRMLFDLSPLAKGVHGASKGSLVCNLYDTKTAGSDIWYSRDGIAVTEAGTYLIIYDSNYNTSDGSLYQAHLAELYASGNPLIVEYATEDVPEPIDISAYLTDDEIEVEGGGAIVPVNPEYNNPAFVECMFTELK